VSGLLPNPQMSRLLAITGGVLVAVLETIRRWVSHR